MTALSSTYSSGSFSPNMSNTKTKHILSVVRKFHFQLCLALTLTMAGCSGGGSGTPAILDAAAPTSNTAGAADTTPPVISLTGPEEITLTEGNYLSGKFDVYRARQTTD